MLEINLIRIVQKFCGKSAYPLRKNVKRMTKWRHVLCSWVSRYNIKRVFLPKLF